MYEVLIAVDVLLNEEHRLLTKSQQRQMVTKLESNPETGKPLTGLLRGYRRLRFDDLRVVYRIDNGTNSVTIIAIGKRRESAVYSTASSRT